MIKKTIDLRILFATTIISRPLCLPKIPILPSIFLPLNCKLHLLKFGTFRFYILKFQNLDFNFEILGYLDFTS